MQKAFRARANFPLAWLLNPGSGLGGEPAFSTLCFSRTSAASPGNLTAYPVRIVEARHKIGKDS